MKNADESLHNELQQSKIVCTELSEQIELKNAEIIELQLSNQTLLKQNRSYRGMITQRAAIDNVEFDDAAIRNKFVALRQQIQTLVFKFYHVNVHNSHLDEHNQPIYPKYSASWGSDLTIPEIKNRICARIFEHLHFTFFKEPLFGLESSGMPFEIETGLRAFECAAREKLAGEKFPNHHS